MDFFFVLLYFICRYICIYIYHLYFSLLIYIAKFQEKQNKQMQQRIVANEWVGYLSTSMSHRICPSLLCAGWYIYIYICMRFLFFLHVYANENFFFCFFPFSFHHLHLFVPHTNVMLSNECHYHPPCERSEGILTRITNTYVHKRGSYFFSLIQQKGRNPRKKKSRESIYIFFFVKGK